jgi:uncharacterized protein (DUF433 family)
VGLRYAPPAILDPRPAVAYPHIVTDVHGVLRVQGVQYKVMVLLESTLARELSIDEMLESWPELTRAQAHALTAYYHDNKAELDELMREREARARLRSRRRMTPSTRPSSWRDGARAPGRLRFPPAWSPATTDS